MDSKLFLVSLVLSHTLLNEIVGEQRGVCMKKSIRLQYQMDTLGLFVLWDSINGIII